MKHFETKKFSNVSKEKQGFTLIELLIVIAIISVLVTIVIVAVNPLNLVRGARDSRRRSDLNQIKAAMQLYYNDCKSYPATLPSGLWDGTINTGTCDDGNTYMRQVPTDPAGGAYPYAVANSSGTSSCTTAANDCVSYTAGVNLEGTPNTDDGNTLTKCSAPVPAGVTEFRVCND